MFSGFAYAVEPDDELFVSLSGRNRESFEIDVEGKCVIYMFALKTQTDDVIGYFHEIAGVGVHFKQRVLKIDLVA